MRYSEFLGLLNDYRDSVAFGGDPDVGQEARRRFAVQGHAARAQLETFGKAHCEGWRKKEQTLGDLLRIPRPAGEKKDGRVTELAREIFLRRVHSALPVGEVAKMAFDAARAFYECEKAQ